MNRATERLPPQATGPPCGAELNAARQSISRRFEMILAVITFAGLGLAMIAADTILHTAEYERARTQAEEDIAALTQAYIALLAPLGAQP